MYNDDNIHEVEAIDEDDWYYIVRIGNNELYINKSGHVNVCTKFHITRFLERLNQYEVIWEAMTISDYNKKFRNVGV